MVYEHILVDVEDGVTTITLNRPAQLNAMNRTFGEPGEVRDLPETAEEQGAHGPVRHRCWLFPPTRDL